MSNKKYKVHVRAKKTRISVPGEGIQVFSRPHIFEDPWPELIELARADTKSRVLRLEPNAQEEALINAAKEGAKNDK